MKTLLFAAAAAMAAFAALPAAAQELYAQGNLGVSLAGTADVESDFEGLTGSGDIDLENGWLASAALGSGFRGVRVEAEVIYSNNDVDEDGFDDVSVEHLGLLANVLYDFPVTGAFRPYVGAGAGVGNTTVELDGDDADDTGLAWQLRAGATLGSEEGVMWDIGYRYLNLADFEVSEEDASLEAEAAIHAITVGVRIPLGG
jgi:opacity protein-like surface antigen